MLENVEKSPEKDNDERKGVPNSIYKPTQVLGLHQTYERTDQTLPVQQWLRIELRFKVPPIEGNTKFAIWT